MGRLQELLDELRAREAAEVVADDSRAEQGWDSEGGPVRTDPRHHRVDDDSVSRSAPSTSPGTTDSV